MSDLVVRHLHRDLQTALELAIVALAPTSLIERLALASGLLGALAELSVDSPAVVALTARAAEAARRALGDWQAWSREHVPKAAT